MAGYIPNIWRAKLAEALSGRTAIATATLYLGLAIDLPEGPADSTLAGMDEVTTAGYARKQVPAFDAASVVPPIQEAVGTAFAFNPLSADMVVPASYAFLTTAASGTAGDVRYIFELAEPLLGKSGEPINVPAGTLIIE